MKKKNIMLLLATMTLALAGCGSKDDTASSADNVTGIPLDTSYGEVTLCDYSNLTGEKPVYETTEEDIDMEIESLLYDYVEYNEVDGPAVPGNYVSAYITASSDGNLLMDFSEEVYEVILGEEEFGPEFDEKLNGISAGDNLEFSITYDEDYEDEDFAGQKVDFTVSATSISEEVYPELTDAFIQDSLGYSSEEDMRAQITAELAEANEEQSISELRENLIQAVIDQSTFGTYSQEVYDYCSSSIADGYGYYSKMFGLSDVSEVYDMFGMTEEDIEDEILSQVYRMIAVQAIAKENAITVSDEEFNEYAQALADENEFDTVEELLDAYDELSIRYDITEEKVLDLLEEHATVTEVEADIETE